MIRPMSDLQGFGSEEIPTTETWRAFAETEFGSLDAPDSYCDSTSHMLQKLEPIIKMKDFQLMKAALTELYEERYTFLRHALDNPVI